MSFTVYFDGHLVTESPFANSPKDHVGPKKEQLLPTIPINIGGTFQLVPYIMSSTIKGKIRRAAAYEVRRRFEASGDEITFIDWLLWALGGVKSSGSENIDPRVRRQIIEDSALLSMFGAGASRAGGMVGGRFLVDHAIPDHDIETAIVAGARAPENMSPVLPQFLSATEMERVATYTQLNRERSQSGSQVKELERQLKDAKKGKGKPKEGEATVDLAALQIELDAAKANVAETAEQAKDAASDNALGRPLPGYQVIPRGVKIPHRMSIMAASLEQIGFVLASLEEFAIEPVIGAHVASGCGRISARYDVKVRRDRERKVSHVGELSYGSFEGLLASEGFLGEARDAWENVNFDPSKYRAA